MHKHEISDCAKTLEVSSIIVLFLCSCLLCFWRILLELLRSLTSKYLMNKTQ